MMQCGVEYSPRCGAIGQIGGGNCQSGPVPTISDLGPLAGKHVAVKRVGSNMVLF